MPDSRRVVCPCCERSIGKLLRRRQVLVVRCPRCGAMVEININVHLREAGDTKAIQPPARQIRRKERKPDAKD